jgi:hypothetical protein
VGAGLREWAQSIQIEVPSAGGKQALASLGLTGCSRAGCSHSLLDPGTATRLAAHLWSDPALMGRTEEQYGIRSKRGERGVQPASLPWGHEFSLTAGGGRTEASRAWRHLGS